MLSQFPKESRQQIGRGNSYHADIHLLQFFMQIYILIACCLQIFHNKIS